MSTLAIVLIAVAVLVVLLVAGGVLVGLRRREDDDEYRSHVLAADRALEEARAADRGWDRAVMEDVARTALNAHRPGWDHGSLQLVLVDDRPGVVEDRAQFEASDGDDRVSIMLARGESGWSAERVG